MALWGWWLFGRERSEGGTSKGHEKTLRERDMFIILIVIMISQLCYTYLKLTKL